MNKSVYLAGGVRTPIGTFCGAFESIPAPVLGSEMAKQAAQRAGLKGDKALGVIFQRNGYEVSPSHRLNGGDMQWLLRHESRAAAKFRVVYRLVRDAEPSLPDYIARSTIYSIPVDGHEVPEAFHQAPGMDQRFITHGRRP